jgi:hypothetical protein
MQRRLGDHCHLAQEIQESRPLRIRAQRCLAHWTWQPFFPPSRSEGGDRVDKWTGEGTKLPHSRIFDGFCKKLRHRAITATRRAVIRASRL